MDEAQAEASQQQWEVCDKKPQHVFTNSFHGSVGAAGKKQKMKLHTYSYFVCESRISAAVSLPVFFPFKNFKCSGLWPPYL